MSTPILFVFSDVQRREFLGRSRCLTLTTRSPVSHRFLAGNLGDSSEVDSAGELDCSEGDEGIGDGDPADDVELDDAEIDKDNDEGEGKEGSDSDNVEPLAVQVDDADKVDSDDSTEETDGVEASISECAKVYLTVLISSSRGVRNDTFLVAGNIGREAVILRGCSDCAGLLVSIEGRLCTSL